LASREEESVANTIRAHDSDIAAFERHLGIQALVSQID
jgi:hypothetical protein